MGVKWLVKGRKSDLLKIILLAELMEFVRLAPAGRPLRSNLCLAASIIMTRDDDPVEDSYALPFFTFVFIFLILIEYPTYSF